MPRLGFYINLLGNARGATDAFDASERASRRLGGRITGLGKALVGSLGVAGVVSFGRSSVEAFFDSERAATELQTTLRNNPRLAGESVASFERLASAIHLKTAADDESVLSGAAVLGNFNLTGGQIRDLLPLVVDYARRTGRDLPDAAGLLGKASLGNTRALKELGINYKLIGKPARDFAEITDLVRSKVGGFAQAEAQTAAGRLAILRNRFGDIQEAVGSGLVSAFQFAFDTIGKVAEVIGPHLEAARVLFAQAWQAISEVVATAWEAVRPIVEQIGAFLVEQFGATVAWVRRNWPLIKETIAAVLEAVRTVVQTVLERIKVFWSLFGDEILAAVRVVWNTIRGAIEAALKVIRGVIETVLGLISGDWSRVWEGIRSIASGIWTAIKTLISAAIEAVKIAIEAVLSAIRAIWDRIWSGIASVVGGVWSGIKTVVGGAIGWVRDRIESVLERIKGIWSGAWQTAADVFGGIWDGIREVARDAINFLLGILNRAIGGINVLIRGFNRIPFAPDIPEIPGIPLLARGGIVLGSGAAIVGEAGPELLHLPRGARVAPLATAGGVAVTVIVEGSVIRERDLAATVREELLRIRRRNPDLGLA